MIALLAFVVSTLAWIEGPCSSRERMIISEGYKLTVYNDSLFIPHVCIGFNLNRGDASAALAAAGAPSRTAILAGASVDPAACTKLLESDMLSAENCVRQRVSNFGSIPLSQQSALIDMSYNLGCTRFGGFMKMIAAVVAEDWITASNEIASSNYCSQVACRCQQNRLCMNNCFLYTCTSVVAPDTPPCGGTAPPEATTTTTTTTTTAAAVATTTTATPCTYGAWTLFTACNPCGENGEEVYTRTASVGCTGETQKVEACFKDCPPPNCVYSTWSATSSCSATECGTTGFIAERRTVNDVRCPEALQRTKDCAAAPCGAPVTPAPPVAPIDCVWSNWGEYNTCSVSCGSGGSKTRQRTYERLPAFGGALCSGSPFETSSCSGPACAAGCTRADCVLNEWAAWSGCLQTSSKTATTSCLGQKTRQRSVKTQASCEGTCSSALREEIACNPIECGGAVDVPVTVPPSGSNSPGGNQVVSLVMPGGDTSSTFFTTPVIVGIALGAACCCLIVVGAIICCFVVLLSGNRSAPEEEEAQELQPEASTMVANNPIFTDPTSKSYNPLFGQSGQAASPTNLLVAPNSGNYTTGPGTDGAAPLVGHSAGYAGAHGIAAQGYGNAAMSTAGSYGSDTTCPICNQAYPTAADLKFHIEKRHVGVQLPAGASYPSAVAGAAYPSNQANYPSAAVAYPNGGAANGAYPSAQASYPSALSSIDGNANAANQPYPSAVGLYSYEDNAQGPIPCNICGKGYNTDADLEHHKKLRHA